MKTFAALIAVLATSAFSAPTDEAHQRARDIECANGTIPRPFNITVPPIINVTEDAAAVLAADLAARDVDERSSQEASEVEGMSAEKVAYYRSLAVSQAREHFKRNFNTSAWNSSAYNTSQPGFPHHGDPHCRDFRSDVCGVFGGDDKCERHCRKCGHGEGKCQGFLLFKYVPILGIMNFNRIKLTRF